MALRAQWGTYDDMIRTVLGRDRKYRGYDVQAGENGDVPDPVVAPYRRRMKRR